MRRIWLIFSQAVTVALALLFVVATLKPDWLGRPAGPLLPQIVSIAAAPAGQTASGPTGATGSIVSYRLAAQRAAPAVVSIVASKAPQRRPDAEDPWFRFFFGERGPAQSQPQRGLGSGVIVSPEGYLITNHHVIEGADEIEVQLADGRQADAKVVGTDPDSDVAVLKVNLDKLPSVTFGNSEQLQVGDAVLAIGNPFGVGQTVTAGIVSALGRNRLGINTFENFIQTDAAINPGNSGGALVDAAGTLVGINTAIFSRSGGNLGIGFAIPADTARWVMESLVRDGSVTRGWIGIEPRDLTPEMADSLRLRVKGGVLVTGVLQNGPAGNAGMKPGDVVVRIADQDIANTGQLFNAVAALKPNTTAAVTVQRGDRVVELKVQVAQRPRSQRGDR